MKLLARRALATSLLGLAVAGSTAVTSTHDADAAAGLVLAHVWSVFPADTGTNGAVIADTKARTAVVTSDAGVFSTHTTRAQLISLDTGRLLSPLITTPDFEISPYAAYWVDEKRDLLIYAAPASSTPGSGSMLVGLKMTAGTRAPLFKVPLRFGTRTALSIAGDPTGSDVFVAASNDESATGSQVLGASGSGVQLDRLSIAGLLKGSLVSPWSAPYSLPVLQCAALIASRHPAQMLAVGSRVFLPCREPQAPLGNLKTVNALLSGIVALDGVSSPAPTISTRFYPAPGNYAGIGESIADVADARIVLIDSSYGFGARVFDARHGRYVGRVPLGGQQLSTFAVDGDSGRLYVGTPDASVGLGYTDLRALVPTQGLRLPSPWAQLFANNANVNLTVGYDAKRRNLLLPLQTSDSHHPFQVYVVHDTTPRYVAPLSPNPDAGTVDADEHPGTTYSQRAASAQAFGADYQLIGGRANIRQNVAGDSGTSASPGSNFLRQSEIDQATLSNDESTAHAVIGREDSVTDSDRSGVPGAGATFASPVGCSDFGSSAQDKPRTADTAAVTCDLNAQKTTASADFVADHGVLVTVGHGAPAAAPVQVSRSSVAVSVQRLPQLGAVVTTVTASADGIQLPGAVRIGNVTSTVRLSTHGRSGSASAVRTVTVDDVAVAGNVLCTSDCSLRQVQSALDVVAPSRFAIDFPAAQVSHSARGTYAEVVQDPWYHAERVLDADKADTDLAVPGMTITVNMDGTAKSRLVVDLAGVAATSAYRVYPQGTTAPPSPPSPAPTSLGPHTGPLGPLTGAGAPQAPAVAAATPPATGVIPALRNAAHFVLGSLGRLLSLLPVFVLLGVPVYLSARRRLLLDLPLLTRDEEMK